MSLRSTVPRIAFVFSGLVAALLLWHPARVDAAPPTNKPQYTTDGNLIPPADYRQWVFLSSGYDMAYTQPAPGIPEHPVFDNVFVNPEAYSSFQKTGTWPDGTTMVLENRAARAKGESLVKGGRFQGEVSGLEIHVKDSSRFNKSGPGGQWAFFSVNLKAGGSKLFPRTASCYTCHAEHAAVDTTFVQFYPTLLPVAESKKTLDSPYLKDQAANPAEPK